MDMTLKKWQTREKKLGCEKTLEGLFNNKYAPKGRQLVSNQNEQFHMEIKMWMSLVQICGPFSWMFYLILMELKHNFLCLNYILQYQEKYPSFSEKYLNNLTMLFDLMLSFKELFHKAKKYGYQEIKLKPREKKDFEYYLKAGILKEPSWNYQYQKKMIQFVLVELKIMQNPNLKLTSTIINDCWDYFGRKFGKNVIEKQLQLIFFKYIFLFLPTKPLLCVILTCTQSKTTRYNDILESGCRDR